MLSNSILAVEGNYSNVLTTQKKLEFLNCHTSCIISDLQTQIKVKNTTIVKLKAAQLKVPVVNLPAKVEEKSPEDNKLVSLLREQLVQKASEMEQTVKLLETAKMSARELSEVFVVDRADCGEKIAQLEDRVFRLQVQVKLVQSAVSEKEKETTSLVDNLQTSEVKVQELEEELHILKSLISRDTVDAETETIICVQDVACQNDVLSPVQAPIPDSTVNSSTELVDRSASCCVTTDDKECQAEFSSPVVRLPVVTAHQSPILSSSKRSPPAYPTLDSNTKRFKSDCLSEESDVYEVSPSPLPLSKRLNMPTPIPIKLEGGGQIATIVELDEDTEHCSPERTQYNFSVSYSETISSVPEEDWLTVANPDISYNDISYNDDEVEPKTPEQLIKTQENKLVLRSSDYRNDSDYSSVESSDQSPEKVTPVEEPEEAEPVTLIKESPQLDVMASPTTNINSNPILPDTMQDESGFLESTPQIPGKMRRVVTVCVDSSSSSSEEEKPSSLVESEVKQSVQRIVRKAFRRVDKDRTKKVSLYKASLSKSPNSSRTAYSARFGCF